MLNLNCRLLNSITTFNQKTFDKINSEKIKNISKRFELIPCFFQAPNYFSQLKNRIKPVLNPYNFINKFSNNELLENKEKIDLSNSIFNQSHKNKLVQVATITRLAAGALALGGLGFWIYNSLYPSTAVEDIFDAEASAAHALTLYHDFFPFEGVGCGGAIISEPTIEIPPSQYIPSNEGGVSYDNYPIIASSAILISSVAAIALSKFKNACLDYCQSLINEYSEDFNLTEEESFKTKSEEEGLPSNKDNEETDEVKESNTNEAQPHNEGTREENLKTNSQGASPQSTNDTTFGEQISPPSKNHKDTNEVKKLNTNQTQPHTDGTKNNEIFSTPTGDYHSTNSRKRKIHKVKDLPPFPFKEPSISESIQSLRQFFESPSPFSDKYDSSNIFLVEEDNASEISDLPSPIRKFEFKAADFKNVHLKPTLTKTKSDDSQLEANKLFSERLDKKRKMEQANPSPQVSPSWLK